MINKLPPRPRRRILRRFRLLVARLPIGRLLVALLILFASADRAGAEVLRAAPTDLNQVITNLRDVIVGLLVGLATLFATIGGVRYILAGGDPSEVEAAKKTLKYAAIGYGVAALAPGLVELLKQIVGA